MTAAVDVQRRIGGSKVAAICGLSSWGSPWTTWAELVGLAPPKPETERQTIGKELEGAIAAMFTRRTGLYVAGEQIELRHRRHDWLVGHADGLVFDGPQDVLAVTGGVQDAATLGVDAALGGFEAKTDGRFGWPDGVPPYYQAQAQTYMLLSGLPRWWFAVLFAGFRFEVFELEADRADQRFIAYEAARFWHRHVLTGIPPAIDGSQATTDLLTAMHPRHLEGATVDMTDRADLFTDLRRAKAEAKALDGRIGRMENEVRDAMGDAEIALVDGQPPATWRKSRAVDVDALTKAEPELTATYMRFDLTEFAKRNRKIADRYRTLDGSRRLLIKEPKETT